MPQNLAGPQALNRISSGGTLVGLDLPPASRNLELKPYAISRVDDRSPAHARRRQRLRPRRRRRRQVRRHREPHRRLHRQHRLRAGRDRRAAGQPHALQPVLSREARLLPRGARRLRLRARRRRRAGGGHRQRRQRDTPYLFYSRRIGLNRNRVIPIDAGGRLTGKVGAFGVGLMNIQTGDEDAVARTPDTNFTVVRVKRDILRRSTIGAMFTNRSVADGRPRARTRPTASTRRSRSTRTSASARTGRAPRRPALSGDDDSYQAQVRLHRRSLRRARRVPQGRRQLQSRSRLRAPRRLQALVRLSCASARGRRTCRLVRKFTWEGSLEYIENGAGDLETRQQSGALQHRVRQQRSLHRRGQRQLRVPARALSGRRAASSSRSAATTSTTCRSPTTSASSGRSRATSRCSAAQFYDGDITTVGFSQRARGGHQALLARAAASRSASVDLPDGDFTTRSSARASTTASRRACSPARCCSTTRTRPHLQQQPALPLGVSAGQRVLPGVDRRAGHAPAVAWDCATARSS